LPSTGSIQTLLALNEVMACAEKCAVRYRMDAGLRRTLLSHERSVRRDKQPHLHQLRTTFDRRVSHCIHMQFVQDG
jgi:hypothetical protein